MKAMETLYKVMARSYRRDGESYYEEYTGRLWDQEHILDAHEELWDAQHDDGIEDAYIQEVTV